MNQKGEFFFRYRDAIKSSAVCAVNLLHSSQNIHENQPYSITFYHYICNEGSIPFTRSILHRPAKFIPTRARVALCHRSRMVKTLMRLPGSRILTSLPIARASGFRQWIRRLGPLAWEIGSHSLCLGDFFHRESEERNWTAPVAVRPRRTRSFSTSTPLLRLDATFPSWRSNSDCVPAISPP